MILSPNDTLNCFCQESAVLAGELNPEKATYLAIFV